MTQVRVKNQGCTYRTMVVHLWFISLESIFISDYPNTLPECRTRTRPTGPMYNKYSHPYPLEQSILIFWSQLNAIWYKTYVRTSSSGARQRERERVRKVEKEVTRSVAHCHRELSLVYVLYVRSRRQFQCRNLFGIKCCANSIRFVFFISEVV